MRQRYTSLGACLIRVLGLSEVNALTRPRASQACLGGYRGLGRLLIRSCCVACLRFDLLKWVVGLPLENHAVDGEACDAQYTRSLASCYAYRRVSVSRYRICRSHPGPLGRPRRERWRYATGCSRGRRGDVLQRGYTRDSIEGRHVHLRWFDHGLCTEREGPIAFRAKMG